jgi:long-chain acyl-CoA synthetase
MRAGATIVPLNVMYKAGETAYILRDSGAKVAITVEPFYPQLAEARREAPALEHLLVKAGQPLEGVINWDAALAEQPTTRPAVAVDRQDVAVIAYTSGTTGQPKGAMLTHHNLLYNCEQVDRLENLKVGPEDRVYLVLPLFHIYALNVGMNLTFYKGATIILDERFDPEGSLEKIQQHRATAIYGAPPMYVAWVTNPNTRNYDLSSVRVAVSGAAALPVAVLEGFQQLTGVTIWEGYGLTEVSPVATTNSAGPRPKPGSVGLPIPGMEVRIVDAAGRDVPVGEPGEIILRGENVMVGYYNKPEATAEAIRDGWFYTGDIGKLDEEGYIYIVDRTKDMINVGGFNVYPREVEEVLYRHPKVADAAVIDEPDPYQGESVLAVVVPKAGETVTAEELIAYCRERLAVFKAPRRVEFRESLPRNLSGKVLKRQLRDEIHARAR